MVKKASKMSAAELKADKFVHYRTIQTGFLKMWDDTGKSKAWYNTFYPEHYAFKLDRMQLEEGANAFDNKEINVGRLKGGKMQDHSFKMIPRGSRTGETLGGAGGGSGGGPGSAEYAKKLLFSWAMMMNPTATASEVFGREMREYEKPTTTKSGLGQFKGVNSETGVATQRKTAPLPLSKQMEKFFWSTLSSKSGYSLKGRGGGRHWGAGIKQREIAAQGGNFRKIYEESVSRQYSLKANFYSQLAMRSLLKEVVDPKGKILQFKKGGQQTMGADSSEELMIAIAGNEIEQWNKMSEKDIADEMVGMLDPKQAIKTPGSLIDIPVGSPAMERAIRTIKSKDDGAEKVKAAIRKGGLEITEQHGRLKDMYDPLPSSGPEDFMRYSATEIKRDIYNKYTQGGNYVRPGKERTIGEQFYDRQVGRGGFEVLTWSEPVFKGVAFFSIFIPSKLTSEDSVGVVTHFEPGMKSVGEAVMRSRGITKTVDTVRRAARSVLYGAIKHKEAKLISTKQLGTHAMKWELWKDFGVFTRVDISAPEDVAEQLYNLVNKVANNLGNMITLSPGGKFTDWVAKQQGEGEEFAQEIHQSAGTRWRTWVQHLGGQAKDPTPPSQAVNWAQPIHPRPFLWMTAAGQSIGSREAILK